METRNSKQRALSELSTATAGLGSLSRCRPAVPLTPEKRGAVLVTTEATATRRLVTDTSTDTTDTTSPDAIQPQPSHDKNATAPPRASSSAPKKRRPRTSFLLAQAKLKKAVLEKQKALWVRAAAAATAATISSTGAPTPLYGAAAAAAAVAASSSASTLTSGSASSCTYTTTVALLLPPITSLTDGSLDSLVLVHIDTSSAKVHLDTSQWRDAPLDNSNSNPPDDNNDYNVGPVCQTTRSGTNTSGTNTSNSNSRCESVSPLPPNENGDTLALLELQQKLQNAKEAKQRLVAVQEKKQQLKLVQQRKLKLEEKARRWQQQQQQSECSPSDDMAVERIQSTVVMAPLVQSGASSSVDDQFADADDWLFPIVLLPTPVPNTTHHVTTRNTLDPLLVPTEENHNDVKQVMMDIGPVAAVNGTKPTRAQLLERKKEAERNREIVRFKAFAAKHERLLANQTKHVQQTTDRLDQSTEKLGRAQTERDAARRVMEHETTRTIVLEELLAEYVSERVVLRQQLHDMDVPEPKKSRWR